MSFDLNTWISGIELWGLCRWILSGIFFTFHFYSSPFFYCCVLRQRGGEWNEKRTTKVIWQSCNSWSFVHRLAMTFGFKFVRSRESMWYYLAIVGQAKKVKFLSVLSSTGHLQIAEIKLNSHLKMSVLQHSNCWYTTNKLHQQSVLCVMILEAGATKYSPPGWGWHAGLGRAGGCWLGVEIVAESILWLSLSKLGLGSDHYN